MPRRTIARLAVLLTLAGTFATTGASASPDRLPANDRARGLVYDGFRRDARCPNGFAVGRATDLPLCSHGPDPAPAGIDVRSYDPVDTGAVAAAADVTATEALPCYSTGSDGYRVHLMYAVASDRTDRYNDVVASLATYAATVDSTFATSGAKTGAARHVRYLTDASCNLVIDKIVLPATGDDSFNATVAALQALGHNRADRKYLVWVDANVLCGVGSVYRDDRGTPGNLNNGWRAQYARVDTPCWNYAEGHELMHTLGGVQASAPNSTPAGHCTDEYDVMCYDDGSGEPMVETCAQDQETVFDCNNDDYFASIPAPLSYLTTFWNTANSYFLEAQPVPGIPAVSLAAAGALADGMVATFDRPVKGITSSTYVMRAGTSTTNMAATLSCTTPQGSPVSCELGPVGRALLKPTGGLLIGQPYVVQLPPLGESLPIAWLDGTPAPATASTVRVTQQQESDASVTYAWPNVATTAALGGSYRATRQRGATSSFRFSGTSISWYTIVGPDQGSAQVSIDGTLRGSINLYWPSKIYRARHTFTGLSAGAHTITITSATTGRYVSIDAFGVGSTTYATPSLTSRWGRVSTSAASSGAYALEDRPGALTQMRFYGSTIDWHTVLGPGQGKANVYIDGVLKATVDNYATSNVIGARRRFGGLTLATHTIKVVVLGTKRTAATGTRVAIDRFVTP